MVDDIIIRPYEARDREAVRTIACDTADRGEPVEALFADRAMVADLLTRYYTDFEPGSAWMAEHDGRVIGYLTGSLHPRRWWRAMYGRVAPAAVLASLWRGALLRRQTWRWLAAALKTARRGGWQRHVPLREYPAHFHMNILPPCRGRQVGRQLLERFIAQARAEGLTGLHAAVRADNARACRFFERLGFAPLSRHGLVVPAQPRDRALDVVLYGRRL